MEGFAEKEKSWYSPPYYLHGGYKMCFKVDLENNSLLGVHRSQGVEKYLRIDHYILQGPIDDALEWPFTGTVIIEVVNQKGNNNFSYEYDYKEAGNKGDRVPASLHGTSRGINFGHTSRRALMLPQLPDKGYLVDDTLKFVVTCI